MLEQKIRFYHLWKQNLIEKTESNFLDLIDNHIGLHSTDYLTPYFSLWARIKNFEPRALYDSLNKTKDVLRMTAFRGTLFIINRKNIASTLASMSRKRELWIKDAQNYSTIGLDYQKLERDIIALFKKNPLLKNPEIKKALADRYSEIDVTIGMRLLGLNGIVIRAVQKNITDKIYKYSLLEDWMPDVAEQISQSENSVREVLLKYIDIFGPVSLDDFCWWLPETKTNAREYLIEIENNLEIIDFNGSEYFIKKNEKEEFENFEYRKFTEPIINFLPYEDHFPKAYQERSYFISEDVKTNLFGVRGLDKGEIRPSIWLNGEVIGRWEYSWADNKKTTMKIDIIYLDRTKISSEIITNKIEEIRLDLENFTNEKIIPLIKMKKKEK
ncbi:MAG: hypothetical protein EAX90_13465 [Candidatus Heimdallarchaeota archaeon]|nr:hypothetical protein [Candidatus Heimdallarchaeota archaeon]